MKKISMLLLLCSILFSFSVNSQPSKMAIVQGTITGKFAPTEIALYSVANGETVLHSKVAVAKDGTFGFCFTPEYNGVYRIGERTSPARIYITPGKQTTISITDEGFSVLTPGDEENLKMAEWTKLIWCLKGANMLTGNFTYKEIFPILPDIEKQKNDFVSNLKTKNPVFNNFIKGMAQAEFETELYHFLQMPRTVHPKFEEQPEVYKRLSSGVHFTTAESMNYDFGQSAVQMYLMYLWSVKASQGVKPDADFSTNLCIDNIKNDTLKGWYFLNNQLLRTKAYDQVYRDKVEKFGKYLVTDTQKKKLHDFELTIRTFGDGEQAIGFDGTTIDGKKVSLSDFKGKVVVVDVWATWCGPCKKEIPSLQKLEEEMAGKDVVFISYSIDEIKDREKWSKMVTEQKLGGVQIIGDAAWKSPICTNYKITGIPRFMVFNKKGQIVSIDSPRPSNPELKKMIETELTKSK